jgi:hypothetical protein
MDDIPNEDGLSLTMSVRRNSARTKKNCSTNLVCSENLAANSWDRVSAGHSAIFALQLLAKEKALAALTAQPDAAIAQNAGLENSVTSQ